MENVEAIRLDYFTLSICQKFLSRLNFHSLFRVLYSKSNFYLDTSWQWFSGSCRRAKRWF